MYSCATLALSQTLLCCRLNFKYLIHAQDEKLFQYLKANVTGVLAFYATGYTTVDPDQHEAFGAGLFYAVTNNKLQFAINVLELGFDML